MSFGCKNDSSIGSDPQDQQAASMFQVIIEQLYVPGWGIGTYAKKLQTADSFNDITIMERHHFKYLQWTLQFYINLY